MNLDFGILWIEDSFSLDEKESLNRRVLEMGFIARIEVIPNGNGIEDLSRKHKLYHSYDIILLDYRLKDERGDELAIKVRSLFPSTSILFYSGSVEEQQLREMIAAKQVEGVYCSARQRFIERTGSLIEQTARALDRLSGMRGLAMRVVAECDDLMKSAMLSMCSRDVDCVSKLKELDEDVLNSISQMREKYENSVTKGLIERLNTRAVDSAKIFHHFRRLTHIATKSPNAFGLSEIQIDRLRELRKDSARYVDIVLKKRNILGHVAEVPGENGWILQGTDDITVDDFPEIRRIFAVHISTFREMKDLVVLLDGQQSE